MVRHGLGTAFEGRLSLSFEERKDPLFQRRERKGMVQERDYFFILRKERERGHLISKRKDIEKGTCRGRKEELNSDCKDLKLDSVAKLDSQGEDLKGRKRLLDKWDRRTRRNG